MGQRVGGGWRSGGTGWRGLAATRRRTSRAATSSSTGTGCRATDGGWEQRTCGCGWTAEGDVDRPHRQDGQERDGSDAGRSRADEQGLPASQNDEPERDLKAR